jgi:hypothetical protein
MIEQARLNAGGSGSVFPFRIRTSWISEKGMLRFVSARNGDERRAGPGGDSRGAIQPTLGAMLENGALRAIEWDHSDCGTAVPFAVQGMAVGCLSLGEQGVYRFPALSVLARSRPTELAGEICAMLRQSPAHS